MNSAAKREMLFASGDPAPILASAVLAQLAGNSRHGHITLKSEPHQRIELANCTLALGLAGTLLLNRGGSRCTGKERDSDTGLDNFDFRMFASNEGRFLSPDPEQTSGFLYPDDPQSWNGYSYARNSPVTMIDPDGLAYCTKGDSRTDAGSKEDCESDGGTWNYEPGDEQVVKDSEGNPETVETPGTTVTVDGETDTVTVINFFIGPDREIPLSPSAERYGRALYAKFATFPNICSLTFSLNAGAPKGRMRVGAEYNTDKGLALRGRAQGGTGPVKGRVTITSSGKVSTSVRVGGAVGVAVGFSGRNITSVGASANFSRFVSGGVSGQVEPFYKCRPGGASSAGAE